MKMFERWKARRATPPSAARPPVDDTNAVVDIGELASAFEGALALRHRPDISPFAYADHPGGQPTLLATTAAVNIRMILGGDLGNYAERAGWAAHISDFKFDTFRANNIPDPEHALCMAVQALNLLGTVPRLPEHCFSCLEIADLDRLIATHDWKSTHKALWGRVAPLLASGLVNNTWRTHLFNAIEKRLLDEAGDVRFGLDFATGGGRTISILYHLGMIYDTARAPYPFPREMARRLLNLDWPASRRMEQATLCSDADWAWLLTGLARQEPEFFHAAMDGIRRVARARAAEWNAGEPDLQALSTHHLYCYLWSTALFQDLCRECFRGPFMPDTLNLPSLFRIRIDDGCC